MEKIGEIREGVTPVLEPAAGEKQASIEQLTDCPIKRIVDSVLDKKHIQQPPSKSKTN